MRVVNGSCLRLFQGSSALGLVTSLHSVFPHLLVLVFCIFARNSLVACKREERGEELSVLLKDPPGDMVSHLRLLAPLVSYSMFSEDVARDSCWTSW